MAEFEFEEQDDDEPIRRRPYQQGGTAKRAIITIVWLIAFVIMIVAGFYSLEGLLKLNRAHDYLKANPDKHYVVRDAIGQTDYETACKSKQAIMFAVAFVFGIEVIIIAGVALFLSFVASFMMTERRAYRSAWR